MFLHPSYFRMDLAFWDRVIFPRHLYSAEYAPGLDWSNTAVLSHWSCSCFMGHPEICSGNWIHPGDSFPGGPGSP